MSLLLIAWLLLPFLAAFSSALLPPLARPLALGCALLTSALGAALLLGLAPTTLELIGPLGVQLQVDGAAAPFLLLAGLVVLAVLLDGSSRAMAGPFLVLVMVLLGGLDSAFVATDLVSLYVALEVVGIAAFLLILQKREPPQLWIALRYLLVGNSVMTLYLLGVAELYLRTGSFRMEALRDPALGGVELAVVLAPLLVGLLTKGGLFLSGLWLPRTHAEAPAPVSALLSGAVVAGGLCPLLRLEVLLPAQQPLLAWIGLASAALGVVQALAESDLKRLLAWSTLSQVGLVLLQPAVGGAYALAHGLAKAALFLGSAQVPSRDLSRWGQQALPVALGLPLLLASLSIAGAPPLLGFWTKQALEAAAKPVPAGLLLVVMVGTAAVYARLCRLPLQASRAVPSSGALLLGVVLLLAALPAALPGTVPVPGAAWGKAVAVLAAGAVLELLLAWWRGGRGSWLPRPLPSLERLPDLLGGMALMGAALLLALISWRPLPEGVAWAG